MLIQSGFQFPRSLSGSGRDKHAVAKPAATYAATAPAFSGYTRVLSGRHWVSPQTLYTLLSSSQTPYVGKLPGALVPTLAVEPKDLLQSMDQLSTVLRPLNVIETVRLRGRWANQPFRLETIDGGANGTVYQLSVNDRRYALKIYDYPHMVNVHGPYGEMATGLFFSDRKWCDLAQFHVGNPAAGWALFELIDEGMSPERRPGQSFRTLPMVVGDDHGNNSIRGIRVDYGAITRKEGVGTCVSLDTPQPGKISHPPEVAAKGNNKDDTEKLAKLADRILTLTSPGMKSGILSFLEIPGQETNVEKFRKLSMETRTRLFQEKMASHHPDSQAEAAQMIYILPTHARYDAYQRAMATGHGLVQLRAVENIGYFFDSNQLTVFIQALKTENPLVQSRAVEQLSSIQDRFVLDAFRKALAVKSEGVRVKATEQIHTLFEVHRYEAYRLAMETNDVAVQREAATQINALFKGHRFSAFKLAMDTHAKPVQTSAAAQIGELPLSDRKEAFRIAMATGEASVQAVAMTQLQFLPDDFRQQAYEMAIATGQAVVLQAAVGKVYHLDTPRRKQAVQQYLEAQQQLVANRGKLADLEVSSVC